MEELDPKLKAQMDKFGITLDMLTSVMKANSSASKNVNLEAINQLRAQKQLVDTLQSEVGLKQKDAIQTAKKLKQDELQASKEDARNKKVEKDNSALDRIKADSIKKAAQELLSFAKTSIDSSQSVYNSNQAFTAAIPTLRLVSTAFKGVTEAVAGVTAGIPLIGAVTTGVSKALGVAADLAVQSATIQLENAQKYVDTYKSLSKVGVTFGGDLEAMRQSAASGGMALDDYSKFVTKNITNLALMGGTVSQAASRVTAMGKAALTVQPKLLTIYGGYEEINSALSMYAGTMAMYGADTIQMQQQLESGSANYLKTLKMLESITGKSAEAYKADQDKRAKHAAYIMKIQEISARDPALGEALKQQVYLASQVSEAAGNFLEEKIAQSTDALAQNGQVISKSSLKFQALNQAQTEYSNGLLNNAARYSGDVNQRMQANAELGKRAADAIQAENTSQSNIAKAAYASSNETLQGQATTIAQSTAAIGKLRGGVEAYQQTVTEMDKQETEGSEGYRKAIDSLVDFKKTIDEQTEKALPQIGKMASALIDLQSTINDLFGAKITELVTGKVVPGLLKFAESLTTAKNVVDAGDIDTTGEKAQEYSKKAGIGGALVAGAKGAVKGAVAGSRFGPMGMVLGGLGGGAVSAYAGYKGMSYLGGKAGGVMDMLGMGGGKKESPGVPSAGEPGGSGKIADIINFGGGTGSEANFNKLNPKVQQQFIQMANEYSQLNPGKKLQLNSAFRTPEEQAAVDSGGNLKAKPGHSKHNYGLAVDINSSQVTELSASGLLAKYGFKQPFPEKDKPHIELMAKGGITNGPSIAGEAGPEAVVPLPDGRQIPVKIDWSEMRDAFTEMIKVLKDHKDTSDKMLRASQ